MKREDVKQKIQGLTDEQLQWLMDENGADVAREIKRAGELKTELETAKAQLKTAQDGLAAFDGVDVNDLHSQIEQLKGELAAQADGYAFDAELDGAIRDARGRSVRAIRGMLDVDALKASKNRKADIQAALDELAQNSAWAFAPESTPPAATGVTVNTGAEHGAGGGAGTDGVAAAFASLNPNLKL